MLERRVMRRTKWRFQSTPDREAGRCTAAADLAATDGMVSIHARP